MKNKDIDEVIAAAVNLAHRSTIKSFMTGAIVINGSKVVSHGWSHYSTRRLNQYRSIHAELHSLLRAPKEKLDGGTIFIATVRRKSGNVGLAKPCVFCMDLLHEVGIKEAFYTVEAEEWSVVKI